MTDTQAIKDRLDIVQIIGEYIQLKKAGANWKANCPFHHEKTPSFMVHPEKQIWHCFGCGKGGDAFSFIQEMEGIEFPEALKMLADRAGVKIDTFASSDVNKSQKNRIIEINAKAAYFFHRFLLEMPAAQKARDYVQQRGLKPDTIVEWQIGFIPDQWGLLTHYLLKKGYAIDDLVASGLTVKKDGVIATSGKGFYDRFRGRIMFPIWDAHGNVVGFTGRVLVETETSGGKYVNTPQTLVYDKSRVLYGLNKAKTEMKAKGMAVVVEGQMDVIACHQVGMKNVVAASGTALTLEQIKLLKRYVDMLAMAFDADVAGQNAAKRGIDIALEQGMNIKIIHIPDGAGKDADECLKTNPAVWFAAVEKAQEVMAWYYERVLAGVDISDLRQKQKAAEQLLVEIARLPSTIEQDHWLRRLGEQLLTDTAVLRQEMRRVARRQPNQSHGQTHNSGNSSTIWLQPSKTYMLAENLWALLLRFPTLLDQVQAELCKEYQEQTPFADLYESWRGQYNRQAPFDVDTWIASQPPDLQNRVSILQLKADKDYAGFSVEQAMQEVSLLLSQLRHEWVKQQRIALTAELTRAQMAGDRLRIEHILKQIIALNS